MRDNWDDLRFVLAVAEEGSVSGAARRLGVNHATVLRRIAVFEGAARVALFDKSPHGYDVPPMQRGIIEAAREVEQAVQAVRRVLQGVRAPLSGEIRVTTTDTFCLCVMPEVLSRLRRAAPDLKVELICSNAHADLARTQAEIAVRPAQQLPDELIGESPARLGFAAFRTRGGEGEDWLGLSGALSRSLPARWIAANVEPDRIAAAADSFPVLKEMVAGGLGQTILPMILGAGDPRLESVAAYAPTSVPIWVASHTDLAQVPRIAEARRIFCDALSALAPRLLGEVQGAA
ncbi:MAG: LysR family transcriptional regulator [Proteobacteria bacterium]|nr:LysR family transcriptional regulator [Pseudomonadota bacterium]